jgi:hypothetical protein
MLNALGGVGDSFSVGAREVSASLRFFEFSANAPVE